MKTALLLSIVCIYFNASGQTAARVMPRTYAPVNKVEKDFNALLQRPATAPRPLFQVTVTDSVVVERGIVYTEANERMPVLMYKPVRTGANKFPVVICLHGTGGSKDDEGIRNLMYQLTRIGIMGVAIDARYHGDRITDGAKGSQQYVRAIIQAWKNRDSLRHQHPFYFDTVYDLWKLTDYLVSRPDVAANRIGMMGISMGGIETILAASVDKRIKVIVPVIAAQSFSWSLNNNQWQGRARTIWAAHEQVAKDLGDTAVNRESVQALWNVLIPGITGEFDIPAMVRLFAPRPLLLLNNEKDPNCPLPGARIAFAAAEKAYRSKHAGSRLQVHVIPDEPHRFLPQHQEMTIAWFKKWL